MEVYLTPHADFTYREVPLGRGEEASLKEGLKAAVFLENNR